MILHLSPNLPAVVRNTADAILFVHIGGGALSIITGWVAVLSRKGEPVHRLFGGLFVIFMLVMGTAATYLGAIIPEASNVTGGLFAIYLVATAWMAARRPDGVIGAFERLILFMPLGIAIADFVFGLLATRSPTGIFDRYPPPFYWVAATIVSFAFLMDVRMVLAKGLAGRARIARHVWRICSAFFFACGSFFLGQQKVMPHWMQGSPVLMVLGLAPLGFMIVWLGIVGLSGRFRAQAPALVGGI